jgi:DNA repair protein RadC
MPVKEYELEFVFEQLKAVTTWKDVARSMGDIKDWSKEVLVGFYLDSANRIISREILAIGILNALVIHPREVFRSAIAKNAHSVIIAHNHPTGVVEPSDEDVTITKRLVECGELLGIALLDHVIVGKDKAYSFAEAGRLVA